MQESMGNKEVLLTSSFNWCEMQIASAMVSWVVSCVCRVQVRGGAVYGSCLLSDLASNVSAPSFVPDNL